MEQLPRRFPNKIDSMLLVDVRHTLSALLTNVAQRGSSPSVTLPRARRGAATLISFGSRVVRLQRPGDAGPFVSDLPQENTT